MEDEVSFEIDIFQIIQWPSNKYVCLLNLLFTKTK